MANTNRCVASPGMTIQETFEKKVNDALNKVRHSDTQRIVDLCAALCCVDACAFVGAR